MTETMRKETYNTLCKLSDPRQLDAEVVSSFLMNNGLLPSEGFISEFLRESVVNNTFEDIVTIEDVISVFEQAVPMDERTKNGAIYTPPYIRDFIINQLFAENPNKFKNGLIIDPACGCGAFLYTTVQVIRNGGYSFHSIISRLYGVDISANSVRRTKLLLALTALTNDEYITESDLHIYCANSLSFDFCQFDTVKMNGGYDYVIGNPPYVRSKNIEPESKTLLSNWEVAISGNADLYLPFFEIGMKILNKHGRLGYITLNSFFKSVNARGLRKYIVKHQFGLDVIDFGDELIFGKKLAYTCITFISKQERDSIKYHRASPVEIRENKYGLEYRIEKEICKDIIKPNILHSEDEINNLMEKVIFPYDSYSNPIPEDLFSSKYPKAYQYLTLHRKRLDGRDKGEGNFPVWYAFGRTQAISDKGKKLLFPYMTDVPHFVFTDNENMLIYCGYAIYHQNTTELKALKRILESSVFDYYMKHTSKPYATGYYSYAKNYVKNFGVYPLSSKQIDEILSLSSKEEIDEYVEKLYGIDSKSNKCNPIVDYRHFPKNIFEWL